ncbi:MULTISPECIES: DNA-binding protein [unclassified Nocardiopsis]|uniref:DNA-binding protein n=1 Tax=Nocardiopsis TaxID=2013 RepID=UPI00387AFEB8
MVPGIPNESDELNELDAARRRLAEAGADRLPRPPWSPAAGMPDDVTLLRFAVWRANSAAGEADHDDLRAALRLLESARGDLDALEAGLLLIARAEGLTWPDIAEQLGVRSPQAAQQRFQRVSTRAQGSDLPERAGGE